MVLFYWMQPKEVFSRAATGCCTWFYRCKTFGSRADEGIGPYKKQCAFPQKTTRILTVGGDALIAPRGMSTERSEEMNKSLP